MSYYILALFDEAFGKKKKNMARLGFKPETINSGHDSFATGPQSLSVKQKTSHSAYDAM